jgi:hypothetical protein
MTDGLVAFRLLAGKTQIAPKWKISIHEKDLKGELVASSFVQRIRDSLQLEIGESRFFTDSSAVFGMIFKDSSSFLEFVGTRVSDIRTKSRVEMEWFWVPGKLNPADMGTRLW